MMPPEEYEERYLARMVQLDPQFEQLVQAVIIHVESKYHPNIHVYHVYQKYIHGLSEFARQSGLHLDEVMKEIARRLNDEKWEVKSYYYFIELRKRPQKK